MSADAGFTPINFTSATLLDMGTDIVGQKRRYNHPVFGEQEYILVKAGEAIPDGAACMPKTGQTTTGTTTPYVVMVTTGIAVPVSCVNNTGAAITSGHYFWALTGDSVGYGLGVGAIGDGLEIMPAAAGGGAVDAAAGATATVCGVTVSDVAATVANKIHWTLPQGGPQA